MSLGKSRFLNIDTVNSGDWTVFVVEVCPVHYRMAFNMSNMDLNPFRNKSFPELRAPTTSLVKKRVFSPSVRKTDLNYVPIGPGWQ